jgi:Protein of unknown function (DUF3570)
MRTLWIKGRSFISFLSERGLKEEMAHRAEAAAVVNNRRSLLFFILFTFFSGAVLTYGQDIPENELDVRINSYFDNFRVTVIYPQVTLTKRLSSNTSFTGRYLSDIITSASMKASFQVDGITSATPKKTGGGDITPNEWRHEFGLALNQKISEGVVSISGSYSIEHDYSSKTILGSVSYPFAKKNTVFQLSFAKSFDKVFPRIRTWTKDRNTTTLSAELSQILSKNIIAQLDASYSNINGYMLDGYQVVRIIVNENTFQTLEPVEPDSRVRRAIGIRTNFGITKKVSLQIGYKYYWDSWDIKSHTISAKVGKTFSDVLTGSIELRHYLQTKAFFFKPVYTQVEQYMSVTSALNSGYSDEIVMDFSLRGRKGSGFITNDKLSLTGSAGFYRRYTDSPDWFSGYQVLYAYLFSIGIRYNF